MKALILKMTHGPHSEVSLNAIEGGRWTWKYKGEGRPKKGEMDMEVQGRWIQEGLRRREMDMEVQGRWKA